MSDCEHTLFVNATTFVQEFKDDALITGLITNFCLCIVLFILFLLSRHCKPILYHLHPHFKPSQEHYFAWFTPILKRSVLEIKESHGIDVAIYLNFLRMCLKILFCLAFTGILVILPINYTGNNGAQESTGSAVISIVNIDPNQENMWREYIHLIVLVINNIIVLYNLFAYYKHMVYYRTEIKLQNEVENYTVRITGFNPLKWNPDLIESFFNKLLPDRVFAVQVVPSLPQLESLFERRFNLIKLKEERVVKSLKKGLLDSASVQFIADEIHKIDEKINSLVQKPHTRQNYYPVMQKIRNSTSIGENTFIIKKKVCRKEQGQAEKNLLQLLFPK